MPPFEITNRVPATSTATLPDETKNMKWNLREFFMFLLPIGGSSIMPLPKNGVVKHLVKRKLGLSGEARGCILADENAIAVIHS